MLQVEDMCTASAKRHKSGGRKERKTRKKERKKERVILDHLFCRTTLGNICERIKKSKKKTPTKIQQNSPTVQITSKVM